MHGKRKFVKYSWNTSEEVAKKRKGRLLSRVYYFFDILIFGFRFNATTIDYMKLEFYIKSRKEREKDKPYLIEVKNYKDRIDKERILLSKYSSRKYENHRKWHKRNAVYKKTFNMGEKCWVQYGVWIRCTHTVIGSKFVCGNKVSLSRDVDIDYTGDIIIGDNTAIAEGVKILTHGHDFLGLKSDSELIPNTNRAYLTKLVIGKNVFIATRSIIMPGVNNIGNNVIISAGSVVTKSIPTNTIVSGNPAKIVFEFPEKMRKDTKTIE